MEELNRQLAEMREESSKQNDKLAAVMRENAMLLKTVREQQQFLGRQQQQEEGDRPSSSLSNASSVGAEKRKADTLGEGDRPGKRLTRTTVRMGDQ